MLPRKYIWNQRLATCRSTIVWPMLGKQFLVKVMSRGHLKSWYDGQLRAEFPSMSKNPKKIQINFFLQVSHGKYIILILLLILNVAYSVHKGKILEGGTQTESRQHQHQHYHKHIHQIIHSGRAHEGRRNKIEKSHHGRESIIIKVLLSGHRPLLVQLKLKL